MKHAIANPDSNVIANLVKQVTANPVKHMIANPVNSFLKFALLKKLSVFIFFTYTGTCIYILGKKTIYTVILTKLLHDRFLIPNKKKFSYIVYDHSENKLH